LLAEHLGESGNGASDINVVATDHSFPRRNRSIELAAGLREIAQDMVDKRQVVDLSRHP
jgi:hypothetical protein